MPYFTAFVYNVIKPNAPFGCVNGGGLYDHIEDKYVWTATMGDGVVELIKLIDDNFPEVGIQVNTFYKTYFCKDNIVMQGFRKSSNAPFLKAEYRDIKDPIAKIIFGSDYDDEIFAMERALKSHPLGDKFDFIRSERTLFEILPRGIGKGTVLEKLTEYLNVDINKTVAIGDYDNDISMMRAAKLGIAVSNACPNAKAAADAITVSNEEDAIAEVIYGIRDGKYVL